jgi:2-polyprenyl-3-methyl-5-hydroxy-6-metoxy-1,4-benzoquinol methylase
VRLPTKLKQILTRWRAPKADSWPEVLSLLGRVNTHSAFQSHPLPTFSSPQSQVCGFDQFLEPAFLKWSRLLGHPLVHHRKLWEYCYILQVAEFFGVLKKGNSALGFGVGIEPLPSALAKLGLSVLATDQPEGEMADSWAATGQHAAQLESIFRPNILGLEEFKEKVQFRSIDMTRIPADIGCHDLIWSSCTIEHLGSPASGLAFVRESLSLLKPGGISVHTTELDLEKRTASIDFGHCALYQAHEIVRFFDNLNTSDFTWRLNLRVPLNQPEDRWISKYPYPALHPHLKLELNGALTTSLGIFVQKNPSVG